MRGHFVRVGALAVLAFVGCSPARAPQVRVLTRAASVGEAREGSRAEPSAGDGSVAENTGDATIGAASDVARTAAATPTEAPVVAFVSAPVDREPVLVVLPNRPMPRSTRQGTVFGTAGDGSADALAGAARGTFGTGWGGGGLGEGTIGLGTVGTRGLGRGGGDGSAGYGTGAAAPSRSPSSGAAGALGPGSGHVTLAVGGSRAGAPSAGLRRAPTAAPEIAGAIDPSAIRRVIGASRERIEACAAQARVVEPGYGGRVTVRFAVAADGVVVASTVSAMNSSQPSVGACVAGVVRTLRFGGRFGGGVIAVNYPFVFLHPDGREPAAIELAASHGDAVQGSVPARVLTAATVGDSDRRQNYREYLARHEGERRVLDLEMGRRVRFVVRDVQGRGVNGARVTLTRDNTEVRARTHADGTWDYFPSLDPLAGLERARGGATPVQVRVEHGGASRVQTVAIPAQGDGPTFELRLAEGAASESASVIDLAFVIDVTGSMEDELRYINTEVASVVQRVRAAAPNVQVRVSAVFYGDRGDPYLVRAIPFSRDVDGFGAVMQQVHAGGGGDYPEDMNAGLEAALAGLAWSGPEAIKVLVLVADAPPQPYEDENFTWRSAMRVAREHGVRVLPVAASGADRTVEYLFRAMGAYTSTPYVYLTDDSGIGNAHMEADTDRVAVERFNDLLVRMLASDLRGEGMHEPLAS